MPENTIHSNYITAVHRTFKIIQKLIELDGAKNKDLVSSLGYPKSTIHRYLVSLEDQGYVIREGDIFYPSSRFLSISEYCKGRKVGYQLAEEKTKQLARETGERATFSVEEHGRGVRLFREFGEYAVNDAAMTGQDFHLHVTATGKSILAQFSRSRVEQIIEQHGLPKRTENTITEKGELFNELENITERGYSFNKGERIPGLWAVGVPVFDGQNNVIGSMSLGGPEQRLGDNMDEEDYPKLLLSLANEIEVNLKSM